MPTRFLSSMVVVCTIIGIAGIPVGADPWYSQTGLASYYGKGFAGQKTASGERFSRVFRDELPESTLPQKAKRAAERKTARRP